MKKLHHSDLSCRGAAPSSLIWIVTLLVAFLVSISIAVIESNDAEAARTETEKMQSERDIARVDLEKELSAIVEISKILGFYDDTLMGSGKSGFVITHKRLCWKNTLFPPQYILWQHLITDDLKTDDKKVSFMRAEISITLNDSVLDCLPAFLKAVQKLNLPTAYKLTTKQSQILQLAYRTMGIQNGIYCYPHIPRAKLTAAEESYCGALPNSENPILLYDDTFFGGADTGFLLTETTLYWRNMFVQSKSSSLEELSGLEVSETSSGVKLGEDEVSVYLSGLRPLVKIFLEELLKSRASQTLS